MSTTVRRVLPVALTAAFVSACADAPTSTVRFAPDLPSLHQIPVAAPVVELVGLCKVGPAGTYTFNATADQPVLRNEAFVSPAVHNLTAATYTVTVTALSTIDVGGTIVQGACYNFGANHSHMALASGGITANVTVVETGIPAGIDFDHVVVYQRNGGTVTPTSSTTNSASAQAGGAPSVPATLGANIVFYNVVEPPPPPPPGLEGCTPGYWKQDHHFDSWTAPYDPTDDFDATFGVNFFSTNITLLQALELQGGKGGLNQLARAAVAALLNAASGGVDSPQTIAEVLAAVQGATPATYDSVKNVFAANNELGCPLN
jgi:hypothetical protein